MPRVSLFLRDMGESPREAFLLRDRPEADLIPRVSTESAAPNSNWTTQGTNVLDRTIEKRFKTTYLSHPFTLFIPSRSLRPLRQEERLHPERRLCASQPSYPLPYSVTFPSTTTATYFPDFTSRNCTTLCRSRASCPHRLGFSGFCSIA